MSSFLKNENTGMVINTNEDNFEQYKIKRKLLLKQNNHDNQLQRIESKLDLILEKLNRK